MLDESQTFARMLQGAEAKEAFRHFLERRKPVFSVAHEHNDTHAMNEPLHEPLHEPISETMTKPMQQSCGLSGSRQARHPVDGTAR